MTEPDGTTSRRRLVVIGAVLAAIVAVVVVVLATRSDDSSDTTTTSLIDIGGPAVVTGIAGAAPVTAAGNTSPTAPSAASRPTGTSNDTLILQRKLLEPGRYDCTDTGVWQPFQGLEVTLLVGEPAAGSSCTGDILDMPIGTCSTAACSEVPANWRFETLTGTPPAALLMVVAPVSATTSEFVCVVNLAPQPKQILADATTIDQVCPAGASANSNDIPPYVPPASSDIPYVPPPVSVDLPAG